MILTRKELAEELKVSERKIARMEKNGLPVMVLGNNTRRYDFDKVLTFIANIKR